MRGANYPPVLEVDMRRESIHGRPLATYIIYGLKGKEIEQVNRGIRRLGLIEVLEDTGAYVPRSTVVIEALREELENLEKQEE